MRATSPSAFFLSLTLHAIAAVLVVFLTYWVARVEKTPPVIFELVAGPPTSPEALEAPALGSPEVKFTAPKTPVVPKQAPPEPVEEEVAPKEAKVTPIPPAPKNTTKAEAKKTPPKTTAKAPERTTYDAFTKKHGAPKVTKSGPRKSAPIPRVDVPGIAGGVMGGSTANTKGGQGGKAMTRDELDAMEVYEGMIRNKLQIAHEAVKPTGLGDTLSADVDFHVAANGEISRVRIVRSSGNAEFDESVLLAFRRITWAGPRPDKRSDTWRLVFRMREDD